MNIPELDTPLLWVGNSEPISIADLTGGTQILGSVSSGKTTASGALWAKTCLWHGFGALVLCAKPNERARWEAYARETGREESLVIFSPHQDTRHQCYWRFNFLDSEFRRNSGRGVGSAEIIVELINATKGIVEGRQDMRGGDHDHWERASNQLIRNAVHLLALSEGRLSLDALYQLVTDAPEGDQAEDEMWKKRSFLWNALRIAEEKAKTPREAHNFRMAKRYWLETHARLADRTRSSVDSTFFAIGDVFLHDVMRELFCTETSLVPEASYRDGAIIILDMPIREYGKVGMIAQRLFKYMWQRALLRRDVTQHPRPVMLFYDEAQNFIDSFDFLFQAECREVRCATIAITQNLSNYYAVAKDHDEVNALLANFQTKIFHANSDPITNHWAAESIGYTHSYRRSWNTGSNEIGNYFSISATEQRQYKVEPAAFSTLRKGGHAQDWQTETLILQSGRQWHATGDSWLKASITQTNAPKTSIVLPERVLTQEERSVWFFRLLEWLLIFMHRGNAMDIVEAIQWQDGLENRFDTDQLGTSSPVISDSEHFPVPTPDIAATVRWVFNATEDEESTPSESTK